MGQSRETVSVAQARRIALGAQGLHRQRCRSDDDAARAQRPLAGSAEGKDVVAGSGATDDDDGAEGSSGPSARAIAAAVRRLGVLQIDSVNVLARAHLMPLFSRLGPYDVGLLDSLHGRAPRRMVEAWAHEASFIPVETWPLLAWRRRAVRDQHWEFISGGVDRHSRELELVRDVLAERGSLTATQMHQELLALGGPERERADNWGWNWTAAKHVLEYLFATGEVLAAGRTAQFERRYDLAGRVLPTPVRDAPEPTDDDAIRALIEISARRHGIAAVRDLRDYFRLNRGIARDAVPRAISELLEEGTLNEVVVVADGNQPVVSGPWYLHREATIPRRAEAAALLSPFDPVVFGRARLAELFGLDYRIEIYVPAAKRQFGYYVLPFLQGDQFTARVDLKADRAAGTLLVKAAHAEPTTNQETPGLLAAELQTLAGWLSLTTIVVEPNGNLAERLAAVIAANITT